MRIPAKIYRKSQRQQVSEGNIVYQFEDLVNSLPHRLTPRDDPSYQESKRYFADSPMHLSAGEWTVNEPIQIVSDNGIHIVGSGYKTILNCGPRNSAGVMTVSGNDVLIEDVKFSRTTDSSVPDVGTLLSVTGQRVVIRNCWFDGSNASNIISANLADDLVIESCVVTGGGRNDILYLLDCDRLMVKNNRITPQAGFGANAIHLASTDVAVVAERCNDGVVVGNHVGGVFTIRYNASGAHAVVGNNTSANLVAYV